MRSSLQLSRIYVPFQSVPTRSAASERAFRGTLSSVCNSPHPTPLPGGEGTLLPANVSVPSLLGAHASAVQRCRLKSALLVCRERTLQRANFPLTLPLSQRGEGTLLPEKVSAPSSASLPFSHPTRRGDPAVAHQAKHRFAPTHRSESTCFSVQRCRLKPALLVCRERTLQRASFAD